MKDDGSVDSLNSFEATQDELEHLFKSDGNFVTEDMLKEINDQNNNQNP